MNESVEPAAEVRAVNDLSNTTARLTRCCPVLLVRNLDAAVTYYHDRLGFEERLRTGDPAFFAIMRRDDCTVMLREADDPTTIVPLWTVQDKVCNVYFYVDDATALYREFQDRGAHIDYELYDAPYGVREFGIQDADGYDIAFGQVL